MPRRLPPKSSRHTMDLAHKRPIPLSKAKHAAIIRDMQGGDWPAMISLKHGIAPSTLMDWVLKGLDQEADDSYRAFADDFVRTEAEVSGELVGVIMKAARGKLERFDEDSPYHPPSVEDARWMLVMRFHFLWRPGKDGKSGGESAAEVVCRKIEEIQSEERDKVRKLLAKLPEDAKREARESGFLVP